MNQQVILRLTRLEDAPLLLTWRNDPDVRAVVSSSKELNIEEHVAWLSQKLTSRDAWLYVAELDNLPIGQGRIERSWKALSPKMDSVHIGYSIASEHRGKGYGKQLVRLLVEQAHTLGFATVNARIKRGNLKSLIVAMQAGVNGIELF